MPFISQTLLIQNATQHLLLDRISISLIPLTSERPHAKVATADITGVQIIKVPPQTPKAVLARLDEQVHLAARLRLDPIDIALHVEVRVARADDGDLHVEQLGQSLLPLVRARRVAQPGVEAHHRVEVGVEGTEVLRFVQRVEIFHVSADFHLAAETIFDDRAEGVGRRPRWEGEFVVAVGHALGADEDQVEGDAREEVRELEPDFARERGFGAGTEDEKADWRGVGPETFDGDVCARSFRVESVAKGWDVSLVFIMNAKCYKLSYH